MICLPSYFIYFMQPLDIGCFGVLQRSYRKHLREWLYRNLTSHIRKLDLWEVLCKARSGTYTVETIKSA